MRFNNLSVAGLCLGMAACGAAPPQAQKGQRWEKLDHSPPAEVLAALPAGLGAKDMLARYDQDRPGPCYYYVQYGERHPVVTADMRAAGITDAPICVR